MNSLKVYEKEIFNQQSFIKKFQSQKQIPKNIQKKVIFSGSGDSLVSAMLAEVYSDYQARCFDPLDLIKNKLILKNKASYFVSVSGNTISNINAAKISKNAIAITSNPNSRLAKVCRKSIILEIPKNDIFTAGSVSFLASALTCISLVKKITIPTKNQIFKKALTDAKKSSIKNRVFILGNLYTFPLAMYCAAKIFEVLGHDAHYVRIEQFSHMELFTIKKDDTVIIFERKNDHVKYLIKNLKNLRLNIIHPHLISDNKISQLLYYVYFSQLLSLFEAKKRKQKNCHFIVTKKNRNASNKMIY